MQLYGVSVDSPFSHLDWRTHLGLPDDLVLLSDFNREFGERYGLLNTTATGLRNVLRRTVFVIGPDGKIGYRWDVPDPPRIPNTGEILPEVRKVVGRD